MTTMRDHPLLMDDNLFPPFQMVVSGKYRGRKKRIFVQRAANESLTRTVCSTPNGWHRAQIIVGGNVVYQSRPTHDKAAAWEVARSIEINGAN